MRFLPLLALLSCFASAYDIIPRPNEVAFVKSPPLTELKLLNEKICPDDFSSPEAYQIDVLNGVRIRAASPQALVYARASLTQLREQLAREGRISQGVIKDAPQYAWRGYMLDVARHYMPMADVKKLVSELARYKFNRFHLHLTDDNGWRFEVPGYPKLKSVASHRPETFGNGVPEGGIYSRAELQDLVAHCASLGMELIPEMDMPSHNQALAAAYPEFFCQAEGMMVRTGAHAPDKRALLVCPERPELWQFLDAALAELALIFPSSYVHLGGDEAPTTEWDVCPACLKARAERSYADGHDQMREFLARMAALAKRHKREPLFWYEKDESLYRKGELVFTWYSEQSAKALAAAQKHDFRVILNPSTYCYLDFPQIEGQRRYDWMPTASLKDFYSLRPSRFPQQKQLVGVQCNLWTERVPNLEHAFYQTFPRAMATAEMGWSSEKQHNFADFSGRVERQKGDFMKRTGFTLERTKQNQPALNHKE